MNKDNAVRLISELIDSLKKHGERFVVADSYSDQRNSLLTPDFPAEGLWIAFGKLHMIGSIISFEQLPEQPCLMFTDQDGYKYRALFGTSGGGTFRIEALHGECPICFGTGINDGAICGICTNGWITPK